MSYPNTTGYAHNSETSKASAAKLDESGAADSQAAYILASLTNLGLQGATVDELTISMAAGDFPNIHNGTVAGRVVHLERRGEVIKTAVVRKTRSNRQANVYMLAKYADKVIVLSTITLSDLRPTLKKMYDTLEGGQAVRILPQGDFHLLLKKYFDGSEE